MRLWLFAKCMTFAARITGWRLSVDIVDGEGHPLCPVCKSPLLGGALRHGRDGKKMCESCYRDTYMPPWPPPFAGGVWLGPDGNPYCFSPYSIMEHLYGKEEQDAIRPPG